MRQVGSCELPIDELSGLAFHAGRGTLFAVGDDSGRVFEISVAGAPEVIDEITLKKGRRHDLEGIAVDAATDTLLVTSEAKRKILRYDYDGRLLQQVDVDIGGRKNSGLEGLTVAQSGDVFAVHERRPKVLVHLNAALELVNEERLPGLDDLSGVCAHDGALWVVSDKSAALCRAESRDGAWCVVEQWDLERESAEGVALVDNLVYVGFDVARGDNLVWYDRETSK